MIRSYLTPAEKANPYHPFHPLVICAEEPTAYEMLTNYIMSKLKHIFGYSGFDKEFYLTTIETRDAIRETYPNLMCILVDEQHFLIKYSIIL
jgi:hypothetical protein